MHIPVDFVWLEATALAGVRIAAFLVIAPPFSYGAIPMRVKAMLAVALSLTMGAAVAPGYQPLETGPFSLVDISIRKSVKFPCPTMTLGGLVVDEDSGAVLGAGVRCFGRNDR